MLGRLGGGRPGWLLGLGMLVVGLRAGTLREVWVGCTGEGVDGDLLVGHGVVIGAYAGRCVFLDRVSCFQELGWGLSQRNYSGGEGFPSVGFKCCARGSARQCQNGGCFEERNVADLGILRARTSRGSHQCSTPTPFT